MYMQCHLVCPVAGCIQDRRQPHFHSNGKHETQHMPDGKTLTLPQPCCNPATTLPQDGNVYRSTCQHAQKALGFRRRLWQVIHARVDSWTGLAWQGTRKGDDCLARYCSDVPFGIASYRGPRQWRQTATWVEDSAGLNQPRATCLMDLDMTCQHCSDLREA